MPGRRPTTSYRKSSGSRKHSAFKTSKNSMEVDDSQFEILARLGEPQRPAKIPRSLQNDVNGIANVQILEGKKSKTQRRRRNQPDERPLDRAKRYQEQNRRGSRNVVFDQSHPQPVITAGRKPSPNSAKRFANEEMQKMMGNEEPKLGMNSMKDRIPRKESSSSHHEDNKQPPARGSRPHSEARQRTNSHQKTIKDGFVEQERRQHPRHVPPAQRKPPPAPQPEAIDLCCVDSDAKTVEEADKMPQSQSSTRAAPPSSGERHSSTKSSTSTSSTSSSSRTSGSSTASGTTPPATLSAADMSSSKKRSRIQFEEQDSENEFEKETEETRKSFESVAVAEAIGNDYSQTASLWTEGRGTAATDVEVVDVDATVNAPPRSGLLETMKNVATRAYNAFSPSKSTLGLSKQNNPKNGSRANKKQRTTNGSRKGTAIIPGQSFKNYRQEVDEEYVPDEETSKPRAAKRKGGVSPVSFHKKAESASGIRSLQFESTANRPWTRQATKRRQTPEVLNIDSSDSEPEMSSEPKPRKCDAVRIAIGKKVYFLDCSVTWEPRNQNLHISFKANAGGTVSTRRQSAAKTTEHIINLEDELRELKYYYAEAGSEDDKLCVDDDEQMSFLAIRVKPNTKNDLKKLNTYAPDGDEAEKKYILIEFRTDKDLNELLRQMGSLEYVKAFAAEGARLDASKAKNYGKALLEDSRKDAQRRLRSMGSPASHKKRGFLAGKKDDDILLVYPFGTDKELIENAANGLKEASGDPLGGGPKSRRDADSALAAAAQDTDKSGGEDSNEEEGASAKGRSRSHFLTIRVSDYERLEPLEWLNDTLVDFWMRWISRNDDITDVHFFSSHFYSTLQDEGPSAVTKWTENKGIDVFKKRCIFVPINKSLHWSLCAVINPGEIMKHRENMKHSYQDEGTFKFNEDDPFPFILFFDSLKAHQKEQVARNIRSWLNSEWKRLAKSESHLKPFDKKAMVVFSPRIPYQDNSWDCAVFVCRYAYALYLLLRRCMFSYEETDSFTKGRRFKALITESPEFDFDMEDIYRMREEMKTLIEELSKIYAPWKQEQDRKAKEEKAAARVVKATSAKHLAATRSPPTATSPNREFSQESKDSSVVVIGDDKNRKEELKGGGSAIVDVESPIASDDMLISQKFRRQSAEKNRSRSHDVPIPKFVDSSSNLFPPSISTENGAFV